MNCETNSNTVSIERLQEDEYWFPYHYVAKMPEEGFRQHFVDTWGINYISTIEFLIRKISEEMPETLIDIGCGDGRLTRELCSRLHISNVCGVDNSKRAINLAKAMNQDQTALRFEELDITAASFVNTYDTAVLMEVFEHVPLADAERFMKGVRRSLNSGGKLYLTVPHSNKPVEYKHYQHFTQKGICEYLAPDFEICEVLPFEKRGARRRMLNKLLCNSVFVLNNGRVLNYLYNWYMRKLFRCSSENQCQRIFIKAVAT